MPAARARRLRLLLAFAAVYLVWGSTYLAIRVAVETMPPLAMGGVRMLAAGALLLGMALATGAPRPARDHWGPAALIGGMLFLGGNGAVVWASQHVPSGLVALVVSSVPLWMVVIEALGPRHRRPGGVTWVGVGIGLAGIALLVGPRMGGGVDPLSAAILVLGSLSWAGGSLLSRRLPSPRSPLVATALQMLWGGAWMLLGAAALGEARRIDLAAVTPAAWIALAYLVVFGSIVGFTAYVWLLRNTTPAKAATYAYVNPIVALVLGSAFAHERLTARAGIAAVVIIGAVALITSAGGRSRRPEPVPGSRLAREQVAAGGAGED